MTDSNKVLMYKGFERFWHWLQAFLIIFLALTGFEVHGSLSIFGFKKAVIFHNYAAFSLITLTLFSIFWHFTTGEWRQYIPTTDKLFAQIKYYLIGIFKNEPHPFEKTIDAKLNPLQKLTYLGFKLVLLPLMVITGIIYYFISVGEFNEEMELIGTLHAVGAFLFIAFLIVHVYMTTTGHTVFSNIMAMITGYEKVETEERE